MLRRLRNAGPARSAKAVAPRRTRYGLCLGQAKSLSRGKRSSCFFFCLMSMWPMCIVNA